MFIHVFVYSKVLSLPMISFPNACAYRNRGHTQCEGLEGFNFCNRVTYSNKYIHEAAAATINTSNHSEPPADSTLSALKENVWECNIHRAIGSKHLVLIRLQGMDVKEHRDRERERLPVRLLQIGPEMFHGPKFINLRSELNLCGNFSN